MQKRLSLSLEPSVALDEYQLRQHVGHLEGIRVGTPFEVKITKQTIDARKRSVKINIELEVYIDEPLPITHFAAYTYPDVRQAKSVIVVGGGPAGLFAALRLIELGVRPIVFERGKDVKARRRDIADINKKHIVNADSNYCFGEGGAGTYSDGKLYTRSKKRGDIRRILEILVKNGATNRILVDTHPHIGTNKLPLVVENLRKQILDAGGEIHFETRVTDFVLANHEIKGVLTHNNQEWLAEAVILATGHSARDIFKLLHKNQIPILAKPFAMGVRVEHTQAFVDQCQYHQHERGLLPPASYSLVSQTMFKGVQRGVFSFCMCPGGFIVPSSTNQNELVVNGMSPSRRDSKFANSGIVVAINESDWQSFNHLGPLAALAYQEKIEQEAYQKVCATQGLDAKIAITQVMPAQKVSDFTKNRLSRGLHDTSYQPGIVAMNFHDVLPENIAQPLQQGLLSFGNKMRGYASDLGQMIGIESRTSSPVRVPRNKETYEHVSVKRLYPCGEGAGYAGGIVSAAMDGERCAEAAFEQYISRK
jgi:uncharacterized protein